MVGFVCYWRRHYTYQRTIGAGVTLALRYSLLDAWYVWKRRKSHGH